MTEDRVQRRLSAILAADVVGYSMMMGANEAGTLAALKTVWTEHFNPTVDDHRGRIVKTMGDGVLVEYASAVDAVECAVAIQLKMSKYNESRPDQIPIEFRIGVNVGDIVVDGDDIFGDGVNVAARLEGQAPKNGILISDSVRVQLSGKSEVTFIEAGELTLKNIAKPVTVWNWIDSGSSTQIPATRSKGRRNFIAAIVGLVVLVAGLTTWMQFWKSDAGRAEVTFSLPDKPSVAVLAFDNLSADDQSYFSDGVTEDIITDLSKISGLFVVARNSSFAYKDKQVPIRKVAEELGVKFILKGSVRRVEDKIRITAQLVDALKGNQVWAERYDRELKDVFSLQSEVARQVAKALAVTLKANENERLFQKHTTNIDAYDAFLQARRTVDSANIDALLKGEKLFSKVIELDPNFAGGYAGLAFNLSVQVRHRISQSPPADLARAFELAKKAIEVDPGFAWGYIALGGAYVANGDPDAGVDAVHKALTLEPNSYEANLFMGFYLTFAGNPALAVEHLLLAQRLSPEDSVRSMAFLAAAQIMNRNYTEAVRIYSEMYRKFPTTTNPTLRVYQAAAYALLDEPENAALVVKKLLGDHPNFSLSQWKYHKSFKSEEDQARIYNAAKKAGIPEYPKGE